MSVRKSVAEVRREGWVYRESTYLDSVVNQRYGAIYPHALVTFRSASVELNHLDAFAKPPAHAAVATVPLNVPYLLQNVLQFAVSTHRKLHIRRDPHADVPTKVWPLHGHCTLSPLEHKEFTTRGRHSNIVVAFATRHVHKKQLVSRILPRIFKGLQQWRPHKLNIGHVLLQATVYC